MILAGDQGLLLSRTMISSHGLPYVGRFACDWHRLATTDPLRSARELTLDLDGGPQPYGPPSWSLSSTRMGTGPGSTPAWTAIHSDT